MCGRWKGSPPACTKGQPTVGYPAEGVGCPYCYVCYRLLGLLLANIKRVPLGSPALLLRLPLANPQWVPFGSPALLLRVLLGSPALLLWFPVANPTCVPLGSPALLLGLPLANPKWAPLGSPALLLGLPLANPMLYCHWQPCYQCCRCLNLILPICCQR